MLDNRKRKSNQLHIIIVGCGKVGATLAKQLISDNYDITVIDQSADRVQQITDRYDINGIVGNGASLAVQTDAGIDSADILIAVTGSDELNLLCCIIAKHSGHCEAIARVRTPEYSAEAEYLKEKLGLAMIINPDLLAARAIARILSMPTALSVYSFAGGQAEMIRICLPEGNVLTGRRIMDIGREHMNDVLICAVERDGAVMIPGGSFVLEANDEIVFIGQPKTGKMFLKQIGFDTQQVHESMLIGGSRVAYYLAKILTRADIAVKIIERDKERCERFSLLLPDAMIIQGDATDADFLQEAGIRSAESVVTLTGSDEENILIALHAEEVSRAKTITKINRSTFHGAIERLNLGSVVYPKYITSETITAFVRARASSMKTDIETLVQMFGDRIEAIEFFVGETKGVTDIPLCDLKLKDQTLITCIRRNGEIILPGGRDRILPGDSVIIVTTHRGIHELADILRNH